MLILKVIFLQCFWFTIVLFGASINSIIPIVASICIVVINYLIFKPNISVGRFFLTRHSRPVKPAPQPSQHFLHSNPERGFRCLTALP